MNQGSVCVFGWWWGVKSINQTNQFHLKIYKLGRIDTFIMCIFPEFRNRQKRLWTSGWRCDMAPPDSVKMLPVQKLGAYSQNKGNDQIKCVSITCVIWNWSGFTYPTFLHRLDNHNGPVLHEHNDFLCVYHQRSTVCTDTVIWSNKYRRLQSCSPSLIFNISQQINRQWGRGPDSLGTISPSHNKTLLQIYNLIRKKKNKSNIFSKVF